MSLEQLAPVVPAPVAPVREFTMPVWGGGTMTVPCPTWCVLDHRDEIERGGFVTDVRHVSAEVALELSVNGEVETLLAGRIDQAPFDEDQRAPVAAVRPIDGGELIEDLSPADLDAVIAQAAEHVEALRRLREQLMRARADYDGRRIADYEARTALGQKVGV